MSAETVTAAAPPTPPDPAAIAKVLASATGRLVELAEQMTALREKARVRREELCKERDEAAARGDGAAAIDAVTRVAYAARAEELAGAALVGIGAVALRFGEFIERTLPEARS